MTELMALVTIVGLLVTGWVITTVDQAHNDSKDK